MQGLGDDLLGKEDSMKPTDCEQRQPQQCLGVLSSLKCSGLAAGNIQATFPEEHGNARRALACS